MKRYIKANTHKPELTSVHTEWEELEDGSGIKFSVYSDDDELVFEAVYDYADVDPDAIYDSAVDMAELSLSQQYELSDKVISEIRNELPD